MALRAPKDKVICNNGINVVPDVWSVLDKIKDFSEKIRSGLWVRSTMFFKTSTHNMRAILKCIILQICFFQVGKTGKVLKDVVAVGIGGSFLGPLFVHTALQTGHKLIKRHP